MTPTQHPLYGAFEQALLIAMDRDYPTHVRADAARALGAIAGRMSDRPARVDFRLRSLASANLDTPEISVEIIRVLAELGPHEEPTKECDPLPDYLVSLAAEAMQGNAGRALFEILKVLLPRAPERVAPEQVKHCAERLLEAADDTAAELLLRWMHSRGDGFDAEWTRAFLLANRGLMLRAGSKRLRGLHQLAPVIESWVLEGDFAAKCAGRGWDISPPTGLLDPVRYAGRAEEALTTLQAAAMSRDGTLAGTILFGWAAEFRANIAGLPFHGTSEIAAQTFRSAVAVAGNANSSVLERYDAAILLRAVAPLMREPSDRDRNELVALVAAALREPALRTTILEAIDQFGPRTSPDRTPWVGPDPERLIQIARESSETSLAPLYDTVTLLLRRGLPVDDATARTCLEFVSARPNDAARFVELWVAAAGAVAPWLREWLDAHPHVVTAAGTEATERLHLRAPTAASWKALATLTHGGYLPRVLDPLAYGDRAPLALASLTEAVEKEGDDPLRGCLGGWLVTLFTNVHGSSEMGAQRTFDMLSDMAVRRLVGARTFLRGLDYERRGKITIAEHTPTSARGRVAEFDVTVRLESDRLDALCTCGAGAATGSACKHAAAMVIAVRALYRGGSASRG